MFKVFVLEHSELVRILQRILSQDTYMYTERSPAQEVHRMVF